MNEDTPSSAFVCELLDVLEQRFGHDLSTRQLARTLAGAGFLALDAHPDRLSDYLTLLRTLPLDAPLVQSLVQPAMNNESYFFRDAPTMTSLREQILPPLLEAAQATRVFRVWSAGCSNGEELYTLSILLHELVPDLDSWTLALVGTDIDGRALAQARAAQYGEWSLRSTTPEQRQRYFHYDPERKRYTLHARYRRATSFGLFNLVDASAAVPAPGCFDLVLCRNVAIYFTPPARALLDRKLQSALATHGQWIAGPSDPLPTCGLAVRVLPGMMAFGRPLPGGKSSERPRSFARDFVAGASLPPLPGSPPYAPRVGQHTASGVTKRVAASMGQSPQSLRVASVRPSTRAPAEAGSDGKQALLERLALARAHADRNELQAAHEIIDDVLNDEPTIVAAYLLRADLFEADDNDRSALEALRCAIYLDAHQLEAHFRIGLALERLGDVRGAIVALRNAAALGSSPDDTGASGLAQLAAMRMTLLLTENLDGR
jgi:chemotaxis protein methyltransferase CheR